MKDIIIAFALTVILTYFPSQNVADSINNKRAMIINNTVDNSVELARYDGYFKPDNIDKMIIKISSALFIDKSEIIVNVTTSPVPRSNSFDSRNTIKYKIQVPMKNVIAMSSFFGINSANNQYYYTVQGESPSELLP